MIAGPSPVVQGAVVCHWILELYSGGAAGLVSRSCGGFSLANSR